MQKGVALVLTAGALTAANEAFFAPIANAGKATPQKDFNWRVIPATAVVAAFVAGVGELNPQIATGIGVLALITVTVAPLGNASAPIINLAKITGTYKNAK
jgi:hypothetical protein